MNVYDLPVFGGVSQLLLSLDQIRQLLGSIGPHKTMDLVYMGGRLVW